MSREIKFRAWVFDDESGKRKMIAANQIKLCGDFAYVYCAEDDYEYQINTPDLSQYTGLKDRTGREIYEGDLLENEYGRICVVAWHKYTGQWDAKPINMKGMAVGFLADEWRDFVKVIGSIYENPELLK